MDNTIMHRLKTCESIDDLQELCVKINNQMHTLKEDYINKRIGFARYREEQTKLEECRHYAQYMCDIWGIERMN